MAPNPDDFRVLVFAPVGRDAALTAELLERGEYRCHVCGSIPQLCTDLEAGAGVVILTEEALSDRQIGQLSATLERQPAWSDIPVLLFAGSDRAQASLRTLRTIELLRNVTLLDRPMRITAVISTVRAALRGRARQYELRNVLEELGSARNDAEEANRLKDEFLATLSHELRTPLNAILGWISMLRQAQIEAERIPHVLEIIERNAKAQAQLIADVLDVSRMITGRLRLQLALVDVPSLVSDAIDSVRPAAAAKEITLRLSVPCEVATIQADGVRLQQVCWNLLSNAIKFTPAGGEVSVSVAGDESAVEIVVTDNGVGMSPEFMPFVFHRFRQADQTFTRPHGGLGLGLSIVKHLVEMHGGQVEAESRGLNAGATFRIRFPIAAGKALSLAG